MNTIQIMYYMCFTILIFGILSIIISFVTNCFCCSSCKNKCREYKICRKSKCHLPFYKNDYNNDYNNSLINNNELNYEIENNSITELNRDLDNDEFENIDL